MSNQPITWQRLNELRCIKYVKKNLMKMKASIRMKKIPLTLNEVVGARRAAGLSVSQTANLLGFSPHHKHL